MPRRTLASTTEISGIGLHTGVSTKVRLGPGPSGSGIVFQRTDLPKHPLIHALVGQVDETERRTGLTEHGAAVQTVEHLLAAAQALELDDILIEIDGPEPPILDGSFLPWLDALEEAGIVEHPGSPAIVRVTQPFTVRAGDSSYVVAPAETLRLTTTIEWDHLVIGRQSASFDVSPEVFRHEIAPARTFGFMHEISGLRERGLLLGATSEMAVVLSDTAVASGELRWPDEFVRHKIGDIIGDLALLGARVQAHIIAERPSHQGNLALARELRRRGMRNDPAQMDVSRIMELIPHRYPFLLVDRVVELEPDTRIVAVKSVTINEPFFEGHFPGYPIMPGVLIVEAMAQAGGLLLMDRFKAPSTKVVLFLGIDNVRFRRPVVPGDQLRFELELRQLRGHVCRMRGEAFVDGSLVCEADMMAKVVDRTA
jgi:UDP-3-O-[3-hydroxymyristoyl] N-acetylglucosamine deacetylase/3-hydroxyacyl-[acyl-carrier-protein] dehydratase